MGKPARVATVGAYARHPMRLVLRAVLQPAHGVEQPGAAGAGRVVERGVADGGAVQQHRRQVDAVVLLHTALRPCTPSNHPFSLRKGLHKKVGHHLQSGG